MPEPWYVITDINEIDSPALVIYKDRVQHNLNLAIRMVGDASRLRPHVKTNKSPEVTNLMLKAGITKFKCATIAEAEMLAQCRVPDVLLAYQPTGPKLARFMKLVYRYPNTHFSCLVDSELVAKAIAEEAAHLYLVIDVLIDVNVGMNRTGVLPQDAIALYDACRQKKNIKVIGLHGYDGHINDTDLAVRRKKAEEAYRTLEKLRASIGGLLAIVVSGSPTFSIHAKRKNVECSPGTFIYWDRSYLEQFPDLEFLPAVLLVSRVVSIVNERRICVDLGHKSVAAENPLSRRVHFLNAEDLVPVGHSEEHLVLETSLPNHYKVGDILYGMPFHVCPTCALYERALVIEDGKVTGEWQMVARDRKLSI